ncbi:immunoglobulin mu Fc receptor [Tamandua tetradactyla]|uniref:immunoglobulin mu Fc receptor n=1 Tax=Tamandua tetradactyla TaxID=48850 RepID=UPI0040542009
MDLWLWSLFFLPEFGALKTLPEVKLEGELGGSITIECPLPGMPQRVYLCRVMTASGVCNTVVSSMNFVKEEYRNRVSLKLYPDKNLFLVEVTELTESDSGVYACGAGMHTDRDKTQQITLHVSSEYNPFWEEMLKPQTSRLFHRLLQLPMSSTPPWSYMPADPTSTEFISKVSTPAQKTQTPPASHLSPAHPITHRPRVSRVSSITAAKSPTLLPSTTASKTSAWVELVRSWTASHHHHTKLHRQRAFNHGLSGRSADQGFHILIPAILGLMLLLLLGVMIKRSILRRKAFSKRVRRLAMRMRALKASQRRPSQRPRVSQRPRSQNIYSACPRRAREADAAGEPEASPPCLGATESGAAPQVLEALCFCSEGALKTSCEYMSFYHQPPAEGRAADAEDYINIPHLTHLSGSPPRPGPLCQ